MRPWQGPATLIGALLTACTAYQVTPDDLHTAGAMPKSAEVRDAIYAELQTKVKDPDSIKQFDIVSGPTFWADGRIAGWRYCAQFNAKNSFGAYPGVAYLPFLVRTDEERTIVITSRPERIGAC